MLSWEMTLKECVGSELRSFGGVVPFLQNVRVDYRPAADICHSLAALGGKSLTW